MAATVTAPPRAPQRRRTQTPATPATVHSTRGPAWWLLAVAVGYTAVLLVVVAPRSALGWDESVYASQVSSHAPPDFFSAPRARGITYLIAPVTELTSSTLVLRTYLAVLAGTLLLVAYWPWLRLFRRRAVVPLAALLFAGLWVSMFYGAMAMPNYWVAIGAVLAVGWFVRYGYGRQPRALAGVAAGAAFVAAMRPADALWFGAPLAVIAVVVRRWRRPPLMLAGATGAAVGVLPWLVESYQRFGGPVARLHAANGVEGGLGWHPIGALYELRTLDGPLLCRPCQAAAGPSVADLWWLTIPAFVVLGLVVARRLGPVAAVAVPAACGVSIGLGYLVTIDYAAPRFLLPAYALLVLPAAAALVWLVVVARGWLRPVAVTALVVALTAQLSMQLGVLDRQVAAHSARALGYPPAARALARERVHPTCVVSGLDGTPVAYQLGCRSAQVHGHNTTTTKAGFLRIAHHTTTVYLTHHEHPPGYLRGWRPHALPTPPGEHHWFAFTPPWQVTR